MTLVLPNAPSGLGYCQHQKQHRHLLQSTEKCSSSLENCCKEFILPLTHFASARHQVTASLDQLTLQRYYTASDCFHGLQQRVDNWLFQFTSIKSFWVLHKQIQFREIRNNVVRDESCFMVLVRAGEKQSSRALLGRRGIFKFTTHAVSWLNSIKYLIVLTMMMIKSIRLLECNNYGSNHFKLWTSLLWNPLGFEHYSLGKSISKERESKRTRNQLFRKAIGIEQ